MIPAGKSRRRGIGVLILAAASVFGGSKALADNAVSTAAVLPARGIGDAADLHKITSGVRAALRERGIALTLQAETRNAAVALGVSGRPTAEQFRLIAARLGVDMVVDPQLTRGMEGGTHLELIGYRTARGNTRGCSAPVAAAPPGSPADLGPPVRACLSAIFEEPPAPGLPPVRMLALWTQPAQEEKDTGQRRPVKMKDDGEGAPFWAEFDHTGVFADLGFIMSFCQGNTLCKNIDMGYGGRLRVGYRISSYVAVSISAAGGAFEVPKSTDMQTLATVDRTFAFWGVYPGLRYHPVNRFFLDPFIGVDLGWSWLAFAQKEQDPNQGAPSGTSNLPVDVSSYTGKRYVGSMNGFTVAPQAGLRIFPIRNFAVGIVGEWMIPIWNTVCSRTYALVGAQSTNSGEKCMDVDKAGDLKPDGLGNLKELPEFINIEVNVVFVF
ncbi:MAG: hypothetical protein PHU25_09475 [Deltaproteobacteria bacterium]|nr:hypothetical protein [Deltaproteobacteria bacterium]